MTVLRIVAVCASAAVLWTGVGLLARLNAGLRGLGFGWPITLNRTHYRWLVRAFRALVIAFAVYAVIALVWG